MDFLIVATPWSVQPFLTQPRNSYKNASNPAVSLKGCGRLRLCSPIQSSRNVQHNLHHGHCLNPELLEDQKTSGNRSCQRTAKETAKAKATTKDSSRRSHIASLPLRGPECTSSQRLHENNPFIHSPLAVTWKESSKILRFRILQHFRMHGLGAYLHVSPYVYADDVYVYAKLCH